MHARPLAAALFAVAGCPLAAQPLAFAVDASQTDRLFALELAGGLAIPLGPTGFAHVGGLTFAPDGELLGIDEPTSTLVRLDRATGAGHPLGTTGLGPLRGTGLAFDDEGRLWLVDAGSVGLYELDPRTGRARRAVALAEPLTALATIGPRRFALGATAPGRLVQVEREEELRTAREPLGYLDPRAGAGLAADLEGNLWAVTPDGGIFRVDAGTGRARDVSTTERGFHGLAILRQPICALGVDPDLTDQLFAVDVTTGSVVARGVLAFDAVTGLCRANDGRLLGIDTLTNRLIDIDERDGSCRAIGALGHSIQNAGLAMDALGRLWMTTRTGRIFQVDPISGAATLRSELGPPVDALAARGLTLFGLGNDTLYAIDANTLTWSVRGPLVHVGANDAGLAFDEHGNLFGCSDARDLFLVQPDTGRAIPIGRTMIGLEGLVMTSCTVGPERFLPTRAELVLDAAHAARDRFALRGRLSPVGMIDDLTNVVVLLWLDGYNLPLVPVLDRNGRFAWPRGAGLSGEFRLDATRGTFHFAMRDADLSSLLGWELEPGVRERWIDVRLVVSGAGLEQGTFHARIPLELVTRDRETRGRYRLGPRQPIGGHFTIDAARTLAQHGERVGLDLDARLSPRALSRLRLQRPTGATVLRLEIGTASALELPLADFVETARGFRLARPTGPLERLEVDTRRGRIRLRTQPLADTGVPGPTSTQQRHVLRIGLHVEAQSGLESFVVPVELWRRGRTWRSSR